MPLLGGGLLLVKGSLKVGGRVGGVGGLVLGGCDNVLFVIQFSFV
jgi:hypothetical protein